MFVEKRNVAKKYMLRLINANNPIFRLQDEFGLLHLTGDELNFVYTPYGMITAYDDNTEYSCFDDDFVRLYEGIIIERFTI